jgi:hypothetical protein
LTLQKTERRHHPFCVNLRQLASFLANFA